MAFFTGVYIFVAVVAAAIFFITRLAYPLNTTPPDILRVTPKRWTRKEILDAYEKAKTNPVEVEKFIPPKTGRRYIVVGTGLVGGWITQHLVMRGEDPAAIRMLDLRAPTRPEIADLAFFKTDITDEAAVQKAFNAPWQSKVAKLPLTVFHTAALIDSRNRAKDVIGPLEKVNVSGTAHVLKAAKAAGATAFISTSSSSVCLKAPGWFPPPWKTYPDNFIQVVDNAEPEKRPEDTPHEEYYGNYAVTKHRAETLVRDADDKASNFRTGAIRPGHAIYGTGVADISSVTWRYLTIGGAISWLHNYVQQFVNAQNVSIGHLLFEAQLIHPAPPKDLGGRAYCITDNNPPLIFRDLYMVLTTLAKTPVDFPYVPAFPMLCLAYAVEAYITFRRRYAPFLPALRGDILDCQPATFNVATLHLVFNIKQAREDLGYQGPIGTLDGLVMDVLDWNRKFEAKTEAEKEAVEAKARESKQALGDIPA